MKKLIALSIAALSLGLVGAAAFVYSGVFNFAADEPHSPLVYKTIETMRERSIGARLDGITVPRLDDPQLLLAGGADYNDMCAGCHSKPGRGATELAEGLYPQPPNLAAAAEDHGHGDGNGHGDATRTAARQFWIIKHGIKGSGMAAFGKTHDDARIWAMVAFLQKLPSLNADQYQILTAREVNAEAAEGHEAHAASVPAASIEDAPEAALDAFLTALQTGDADTAKRLLAPDVLIYESGAAERSRDEYAGHHLDADMAFLQQATVERIGRASGEVNGSAWITTESRIRGSTSKGKLVDVSSTETALLKRASQGWIITHLHWSSRETKSGH